MTGSCSLLLTCVASSTSMENAPSHVTPSTMHSCMIFPVTSICWFWMVSEQWDISLDSSSGLGPQPLLWIQAVLTHNYSPAEFRLVSTPGVDVGPPPIIVGCVERPLCPLACATFVRDWGLNGRHGGLQGLQLSDGLIVYMEPHRKVSSSNSNMRYCLNIHKAQYKCQNSCLGLLQNALNERLSHSLGHCFYLDPLLQPCGIAEQATVGEPAL